MYPELRAYLEERSTEFGTISNARRTQLDEFASYVKDQTASGKPVRLNFVCTHNSRRSHLAQLCTAAAAAYNGFHAETYSGGTEATAFNPRAVAAAQRAGFRIETTSKGTNPHYRVLIGEELPAVVCFSKRFNDPFNPTEHYAVIMVCTEADEACPSVPGANARFALPFIDPKVSDDTPEEAATYDLRCAQIAREMLYVMTRAAGRDSR